MASTFPLERVRHYVAPAIALLIGLGVAVGIATVPSDVLNAAVDRAGFASVLPAAASPIGTTGRTILALVAGALIAACGFAPQGKAWLVARLDAFARAPRTIVDGDEEPAPVVRRADAHPDAPPRRPIRAASDLGDPLPIFGEEDQRSAPLPPPAEQPLPADLDRPLADFDPAAVPLRPMAPAEPLPPLVRRADPPAPGPESFAHQEEPAAWAKQVAEPQADATGWGDEAEWTEWVEDDRRNASPPPAVASAPVEVGAMQPARRDDDAVASPPPAPAAPRLVVPDTQMPPEPADTVEDDSIAGLLARLERGAAQRRIVVASGAAASQMPPAATQMQPASPPSGDADPAAPPAPVSLDDTLQRLRRLAAG
ncbi:hypothetical protein KZ810_00705 [Sphingomonas sp. RHCKR47]|uniref:hypothetical protein n=1 Tax=Sphingomonas citricola TaxID=2862498 RepID=UPI001CA5E2FB|nr:hypothetical protein [Sphingomonas citricola]MBW6522006.1 hypothetical protein [Sphingomonas citricola]